VIKDIITRIEHMTTTAKKKEIVVGLIDSVRRFQFCGPSDDPDEQTNVTSGYRHLVIQFKRIAGPMLSLSDQERLNAINVEINDLYSAYDADSEIKALLPDIEAALEAQHEDASPIRMAKPLPVPVCSIVGDVVGRYIYSHKSLERLFYDAGAAGDVPAGNCIVKCQSWLKRMHEDFVDPAAVLGKVVEEFMEVDDTFREEDQEAGRKAIRDVLSRHGLSYHSGGRILGAAAALPTKSLHDVLKERDLTAVDKEFERSLTHVESDPPAAITAACAILESLFKAYIEDNNLEMPNDQSLAPLWKTARKHIGFDPSAIEDEDLKKILSGMISVVDGIGSLRTHGSTAHGHGRKTYRIEPRHARLAIHASHTLVGFFLETWDERNRKGTK
jgi:hypothetical protein